MISASPEEAFRHEGSQQFDLLVALLQIQRAEFHLNGLRVGFRLGEFRLEVEFDDGSVGSSAGS